jgi:hypothetical protein
MANWGKKIKLFSKSICTYIILMVKSFWKTRLYGEPSTNSLKKMENINKKFKNLYIYRCNILILKRLLPKYP